MIRPRTVPTAVVAAALFVLAAQAPVRASTGSDATYDVWSPATCATGAITGYSSSRDDEGHYWVSLSGSVRPCRPTRPGDGFGFVHFFAEAAILMGTNDLGTGPQLYTSASAPTEFAVTTRLNDLPIEYGRYGKTRAICVMRNKSERLACVSISLVDPDLPAVVEPISVDDELVTSQEPTNAKGNQTCGTCI